MKRAVIYCRVSTDEQAQSGLGLDAQLAAITATIGEPGQVYRDEGYSGKDPKRPGLLKALNSLKRDDTLIVAKRDRLARDTFLALWCEKEVKRRGARIKSAAGEGTESDDPAAILMRTLVDAFATYERQLIGQRTSAALRQKRERGEKTGGYVPYGYDLGKDGKTLKTNATEQDRIRLAVTLNENGESLRQIAKEFMLRKYRTKKGKLQWYASQISRILKYRTRNMGAE